VLTCFAIPVRPYAYIYQIQSPLRWSSLRDQNGWNARWQAGIGCNELFSVRTFPVSI
jgi:hypothetical protein